ncbi:MAG: hypothetical protein AAB473_02710 [Patescibacteria group bacterium]
MAFSQRIVFRVAVGALFVLLIGGGLLWFVLFPATSLPQGMPQDFVLTWQSGGGMQPEGDEVILRGSHGTARSWSAEESIPKDSRVEFTLSEQETALLYAYLRQHRADRIRTTDSEFFDGDNTGYDLSWGDTDVHVWGMAVVDEDQDRFVKIYQYLSEQFVPYLPEAL